MTQKKLNYIFYEKKSRIVGFENNFTLFTYYMKHYILSSFFYPSLSFSVI